MLTPGEPRAPEPILAKARAHGLVTSTPADTIVRDEYTPALIHLVSNMLVWGGSRIFHHLHGVGMNEWRILSALSNYTGATARDLIEVLGMNKSIASRSVNRLLELDLISQLGGVRGSRHLFLTEHGARVHDDLYRIATKRNELLHSSLSPAEVTQLNALLVRLLDSADALQEFEQDLLQTPPHPTRRTA